MPSKANSPEVSYRGSSGTTIMHLLTQLLKPWISHAKFHAIGDPSTIFTRFGTLWLFLFPTVKEKLTRKKFGAPADEVNASGSAVLDLSHEQWDNCFIA